MEETLALLWETARVAAGEGSEAARLAADAKGVRDCDRILDEARRRMGEKLEELPGAESTAERKGKPRERAIRCAVVGVIAMGAALDAFPDADADVRGLASQLLVLLRGVLDTARREYALDGSGNSQ